jgi:hypothetical protein
VSSLEIVLCTQKDISFTTKKEAVDDDKNLEGNNITSYIICNIKGKIHSQRLKFLVILDITSSEGKKKAYNYL